MATHIQQRGLIAAALILTLVFNHHISAQSTTPCPDDVPYSYLEPAEKEQTTKCTTDPSTVSTVKFDKNGTFCVVDDLFTNWAQLAPPVGNNKARCFNNFDMGAAVYNAVVEICRQLNGIPDCGFNLSVTKKSDVGFCNGNTTTTIEPVLNFDFWDRNTSDPYNVHGVAVGNWYNGGSLQRPQIEINITAEHSYAICLSNVPCNQPTIKTSDGDKNCCNIQAILLHEMLHTLGLGHISGKGCSGKDTEGNDCLTETQYRQFSPSQKLTEDPMYCNSMKNYMSLNLSCYDICALTKLYCPGGEPPVFGMKKFMGEDCVLAVSTERLADLTHPKISVHPTQASSTITVSITNGSSNSPLLVFSSSGALVENIMPNSDHTAIDVSKLPSGTYFVRTRAKNTLLSSTFVVIR